MSSIILEYSYWWLILILIIAFLFSYFLYKNDDSFSDAKKYVVILLKTLRFSLVFILLFFLLKPLLKSTNKTIEKPIIAFLQDNSESIVLNKDSNFIKTKYLEQINKLSDELSENYEFVSYNFGKDISKTDSISFTDTETNIDKAINEINTLYSNRNIGAVIISTDGIYNEGSNPIHSNYSLNAPIYTIGLGDSIVKKDILISDIVFNNTAYKGNSFPVKITIVSKKLKGTNSKLKILNSGKVISELPINITENNFEQDYNFRIIAEEKGVERYTVQIENIDEETNLDNNNKDFVVKIIESKKKVLILANSPHPDVSAIRKSLEGSLLYDVTYKLADENIDNLQSFDLVILHQLPSRKHNIADLFTKFSNFGIPTLSILGAQTDVNSFNKYNANLQIQTRINSYEETAPLFNDKFVDFILSDESKEFFNDLSPLISNFADYKLNSKSDILLYQKIKNIETSKPLVVFTDNSGQKNGVITGEGIWKWRLIDYNRNKSFEIFDAFINKTVQFLSANIKNEPFVVENKSQYKTDENVKLYAKLYNKSYELVNNTDVSLEIKNADGELFTYVFDKYYESYRIDIGKLPKGDYSYTAKTELGKNKYSKSSNFSVTETDKESLNTLADFDLLRQISAKYNGKYYSINMINELQNEIENNKDITSVAYTQTYLTDIINNIWFFIFLILLVTTEWITRKFLGTY